MTIDDLYPYWNDAHEDLLLDLERIDEELWDEKPRASEMPSIRQIVLHFIESELMWIGHIAQGGPKVEVRGSDYPTKASLIEGLQAARARTIRYLDVLKYESLRAVRTAPADPKNNVPESNMPLAWIFWHVMEQEIFCWGQIALMAPKTRYE